MSKAIFFDRDGTLIKSKVVKSRLKPIGDISELTVFPNARKILVALKSRGFKLVLVTNQPDVERGDCTKFFVDNINEFLKLHLDLDLIKVVYGTENSDPARYKPAPGMLLEASKELNINLTQSYIVGDRWRDIGAGESAGCITILFKSQDVEDCVIEPHFRIKDLGELLSIIN